MMCTETTAHMHSRAVVQCDRWQLYKIWILYLTCFVPLSWMYLYFQGLGNQLSKVLTLLFCCAACGPTRSDILGEKSLPICSKPLKSNCQNVSGLSPDWDCEGLNTSLQLETCTLYRKPWRNTTLTWRRLKKICWALQMSVLHLLQNTADS